MRKGSERVEKINIEKRTMISDFNCIEEKILPHFKGGEKSMAARMYSDGKVKILKARLEPGASIGLHTHDTSCEIIFLTRGTAKVLYNGEELTLQEGQCHYCPKGDSHSLINDSEADVEFTAVVPEQ